MYFYFSFDFYKKSLFILTSTCGHFPVVKKYLFILDFEFVLFPGSPVVNTRGPFLFEKYTIINQESY